MTLQLRIYTINRGKMEAFTEGWLKGVYPLRLKHGFTIPGAWVMEKTNQFVWLVGCADQEDWEAKERAYYASPERHALDPDPAQYIARTEQYFVKTIVPSP